MRLTRFCHIAADALGGAVLVLVLLDPTQIRPLSLALVGVAIVLAILPEFLPRSRS
jgi:hypothetical protein